MTDTPGPFLHSLQPKIEVSESLHKKRENLRLFRESIQGSAGIIRHKPLQLFLEIPSRCNLRCRKCGLNYECETE